MIGMSEVNLGIDLCFLQTFEQVHGAGKGIAVFLCDFVESSDVAVQTLCGTATAHCAML
jgi:hypothetical protein